MPSSGTSFHSLQATSQALHPMQTEVSVKKTIRGGCPTCPPWAPGPAALPPPRAGAVGDARPPHVRPDEFPPGRPARAAAGTDVAGHRLDLLDVHVRVQGQVG